MSKDLERAFLKFYTQAEYEKQLLRHCLIRENFEYRKFWNRHREQLRRGNLEGLKRFGLDPVPGLTPDLILFLDPAGEIQAPLRTQGFLLRCLCGFTDERGIRVSSVDPEEKNALRRLEVSEKLKPGQAAVIIDLRKPKGQLLHEFKRLLASHQAQERFRDEAWRHLEVWKARRDRKPFALIAQELEISETAAKQSFYRAHELIQGRPYDPVTSKRELWENKVATIRKTCQNCPDHPDRGGACSHLCPDMELLVNQDRIARRERLLR